MTHNAFTVVVMTAPTEWIANTYLQQLSDLKRSLPCLSSCRHIFCVSDPKGERVGSGGGTLNALNHVQSLLGETLLSTEKILMIHSGGDSRRAPTCSVIGKAWSSLNASLSSVTAVCPLGLLIEELNAFCASLAEGSLVVASSDVLLDIYKLGDQITFEADAITLVTVPEAPNIARNHGVVIVAEDVPRAAVSLRAVDYLQKPSVDEMESAGAIRSDSERHPFVWIDSGVVVYCGKALVALLALLSLPAFDTVLSGVSSDRRLRIELYSDMLLACSVNNRKREMSTYLNALKMTVSDFSNIPCPYGVALRHLLSVFAEIPLFSVCVNHGLFAHLGTTAELKQLIFSCYAKEINEERDIFPKNKLNEFAATSLDDKMKKIAKKYRLRPEVLSSPHHCEGIVSIGTHLGPLGNVNNRTLVEYSILSGNYKIGENSVVSYVLEEIGTSLELEDCMILQQVPLRQSTGQIFGKVSAPYKPYALLLLGMNDDVKLKYSCAGATICGRAWSKFFSSCGLGPCDIWSADCPDVEKTLWTAKLYPVFYLSSAFKPHRKFSILKSCDGSLIELSSSRDKMALMWFQHLHGSRTDIHFIESVRNWKESVRVSLAEILAVGDAAEMRQWRRFLCCFMQSFAFNATASSYCETKQIFVSRNLSSLQSIRVQVRRAVEIVRSMSCVHDLVAEIEAESFANAAILSVWCWRLLFPKNCSDIMLCRFIKISASTIKNIASRDQSLIDASILNNRCHLLVYAVLELWNATPSASSYEVLCSVVMLQGGISLDVIKMFTCGCMALLRFVDVTNQSRLLLIFSWLFRNSTPHNFYINIDHCDVISLAHHYIKVTSESNDTSAFVLKDTGSHAIEEVLKYVLQCLETGMDGNNAAGTGDDIDTIDTLAQSIVASQVNYSLRVHKSFDGLNQYLPHATDVPLFPKNVTVVARAPVRIDLMGGWSDTPPTCFQFGGAVINVAVNVDGFKPLTCSVKFIDESIIVLRSENIESPSIENIVIIDLCDDCVVQLEAGPHSNCALLKACVILLDLKCWIKSYTEDMQEKGLQITTNSLLPTGSGMGGSSVLAAVIIQAIVTRMGKTLSLENLHYLVSQTEQILTTGGGWQDQIGAMYGGFKFAYCNPGIPMQVTVRTLLDFSCVADADMCRILSEEFEKRVYLIYTGQQRLAKNTLICALMHCAMTPLEQFDISNALFGSKISDDLKKQCANYQGGISNLIVKAVSLAQYTEDFVFFCRQHQNDLGMLKERVHSFIDVLALTISEYWDLKREIAIGSETEPLKRLRLALSPCCLGWSLCGAGGGGFGVAILKRDETISHLQCILADINKDWATSSGDKMCEITIHTASLNFEGISVQGVQ